MRRRAFIAALGGAAAAWPLAALAQTNVRRVGVVYQGGPFATSIDGLRDGLRAAGLEDGRHVAANMIALFLFRNGHSMKA